MPCWLSQFSDRDKESPSQPSGVLEKERRRDKEVSRVGTVMGTGLFVRHLFCVQHFPHFTLCPHTPAGFRYYPHFANSTAQAQKGSALAQGHTTTDMNETHISSILELVTCQNPKPCFSPHLPDEDVLIRI